MSSVENDYELLYMIQTEQDSFALEQLCQKYKRLIWKTIKLYNIPVYDEEDYYQEGVITLHKAALTFDEKFNKTFTRYYELLLKRRFWGLMKENNRYVVCENLDDLIISSVDVENHHLREEQLELLELRLAKLNEMEQDIYKLYFENNISIDQLACKYRLSKKKIYNLIYKIKNCIQRD